MKFEHHRGKGKDTNCLNPGPWLAFLQGTINKVRSSLNFLPAPLDQSLIMQQRPFAIRAGAELPGSDQKSI